MLIGQHRLAKEIGFGKLPSCSSASNWIELGTSMPSALAVCKGISGRSMKPNRATPRQKSGAICSTVSAEEPCYPRQ